ncbi:MAG: hypothetical protein KY453_08660 [Gemmatimonadetes bacterium]|nr:hypothetical protein [Gemmatimonadota bacterium]
MDRHRFDALEARLSPLIGRSWFGAGCLMLAGGLGGYVLAEPPADTFVVRAGAANVGAPVGRVLGRGSAERLRSELERFVETQEGISREGGPPSESGDVLREENGIVTFYQADASGESWLAQVRFADAAGPDVSCAVAVGRVPSYVGGIVLRRSGEVRCSHDLAARIDGIKRRLLPVAQAR